MLEQSETYQRLYLSEVRGKYLVSRPVSLPEVAFGPMRPLFFYPLADEWMIVEDRQQGLWYEYEGKEGLLTRKGKTIPKEDLPPLGSSWFYYYGAAFWTDPKTEEEQFHRYFVKSPPAVTREETPGMDIIEIPLTLQRLDYAQTFTYPKELDQALATFPASYVDRYKRPIRRIQGRTYPVSMDKVTTLWKDLGPTTYPKVIRFTDTPFGVADLEPEHTKEDEDLFQQIPGFYQEKTPRGGSHKLVWLKDPGYKFRYSPGLELLGQTQVTFYGIEGVWLEDTPPPMETDGWIPVGHVHRDCKTRLDRPDVTESVKALKERAWQQYSLTRELAAKAYVKDPDPSHADYMALYKLYHGDIKAYADQFPAEDLPWILEAYSQGVIPHREKHETIRNGLPYLVYLASIIIGREG